MKHSENKHPIDERAQAMELLDRFRRADAPAGLRPGDLCREKRGIHTLAMAPVLVFWRSLDSSDPQDALIIRDAVKHRHVLRVDCMVGFIEPDGILTCMAQEPWRLDIKLPD